MSGDRPSWPRTVCTFCAVCGGATPVADLQDAEEWRCVVCHAALPRTGLVAEPALFDDGAPEA